MKPSRYAASVPERTLVDDRKPKRPEFCSVLDCQTRYLGQGKGYARGYADVVFTLDDGVVIARCAEHYMRQIYRAGRGSMCEITGREWRITREAVQAHWAKLDAAEKKA